MQDHLEDALDGVEVVSWFLDEAIEFPNPSGATNAEPLLVNTTGSWADRPDAVTRVPNLFLAADYVRTYTDLATMEGANEAARRAVNGDPRRDALAARSAATCGRCASRPAFEPARTLDKLLWRLRRPPLGVRVSAAGEVAPPGPLGRVALAAARLAGRR